MTGWQNDKLTKWPVDKNDKFTEWQADKNANLKNDKWQNDKMTKLPVDKITIWQNGPQNGELKKWLVDKNDKFTEWQAKKMTSWQMTSWQKDQLTKWPDNNGGCKDQSTKWPNMIQSFFRLTQKRTNRLLRAPPWGRTLSTCPSMSSGLNVIRHFFLRHYRSYEIS